LDTARSIVAEAARSADIVVVSFHGGAEGEAASQVVDIAEEYFGEDRGNVLQFAHAVVEAGADLVLGHGPHVPRAVELYRGRLIAYSLGNFWTYGNISIKGTRGVMPLLRVAVANDGTFLSGQMISMRQRLPGIPEPDSENTAIRLIATLSRADFPSSPLTITEAGDLRVQPVASENLRESEVCEAGTSSGCTEAGLLRPN
jgi:poly-gamma-glutamate synthesis protein (capsule biosynthesis protein)